MTDDSVKWIQLLASIGILLAVLIGIYLMTKRTGKHWPTIDETRVLIYLAAVITLSLMLVYLIISSTLTENVLLALIAALVTLTNAVNGIALHQRNSSGKKWNDPSGEKQDQLPMQDEHGASRKDR